MDTSLKVDTEQIATFVTDLFRYAEAGEYVSLRGFDQFRRDVPPVIIRAQQLGQDLNELVTAAVAAAQSCADHQEPAVFAPPICAFSNSEHARVVDISSELVVSVEVDDVDPDAARSILESMLGPATIVVSSGSDWTNPMTGEVKPKTHIHWRLNEPTRTPDDHQRLRHARDLAARLVGADPTGKPVVHPLRWPGSWNRKGLPRMARIIDRNPDAEIDLGEALERLEEAISRAGFEEAIGPRVSSDPQAPVELVLAAFVAIPNPERDVHYDQWIRLGYALVNAIGGTEEAKAAFHAWSQKSAKYNHEEADAAWGRINAAIAGANAPNKVGAGTIFFEARRAGWDFPKSYTGQPTTQDFLARAPKPSAGKTLPSVIWPAPVDFMGDVAMTGMPELRPAHLPDALYGFVMDTAERMGVDPAGVALSCLVACASMISDEWIIQPKARDDTWTEQARIWGALVGDPSFLKSPIIKACTRPIDNLDARARERHASEMRTYKVQHAIWKRDGADPEMEPRMPRMDRYLVEGATVEALSEVLRDDADARFHAPAHKVLVRQDEMAEFFANLDRYRSGGKGGGDRGAYLRLYNGGRYVVDRIGRGSFACSNWSACFLGGVQPGPIQQIAQDAADDGLLQRFCYCVPSRQTRGMDREPNREAAGRYESLFPAMTLLQPPGAPGAIIEYSLSRPLQRVVLHAEAHVERLAIDDLAEAMTAMPDTSERLKAALGKWPGLFARLALIFHLIDYADATAAPGPKPVLTVLSAETARRVAAYMRDILLPHLLRAEAVMFETAQTGHARWIAGYILSKRLERITARDIVQDYGSLRSPERRRELLDVMESLVTVGWLLPEEQANPARPPAAWLVNPDVHVVFAERARRERDRRAATRTRIAGTIRRSTPAP